jgi:hypothetical protein
MLTLPASVRIYVAAEAVDLRRGFDGLAAATRSLIRQDPLTGHLFVFLNRRKNRIKLLVWDRTGYLLLYKRLERGTFHDLASQIRAPVLDWLAARGASPRYRELAQAGPRWGASPSRNGSSWPTPVIHAEVTPPVRMRPASPCIDPETKRLAA